MPAISPAPAAIIRVPMKRGRSPATAVSIVAGALVLAASAPAAAPQRVATYSGSVSTPHGAIAISLRVSAGGGEVQDMQLAALPIYCAGNGPPGHPRSSSRARACR